MDKTLLKGLQVLTHVARSDRNVRTTDVASELNMTKSNAYRLLRTLEAAGFVRQNPDTKDFAASTKLWELGTLVMSRLDLRERASDALRQLAETSRETVHLAILDGAEVVYIDKIDSPEPVASYTRLGGRAPAYCVATGKALLSALPEIELASLLPSLKQYSPSTITERDVLYADLAATRARGFAINRGEWRDAVWGLASPIRNMAGTAVAAVGVSGPQYRLEDAQRCSDLADLVRTAAGEIERSAYRN